MNVDQKWSIGEERGFVWWGKDFAQHLWAEPGFDDSGFMVYRVHARCDLLKQFVPSAENLKKLNALSTLASLSGFARDGRSPDRIQLATSMYVHSKTVEWVTRLFGFAVAIQAAQAQIQGSLVADLVGAEPDISPHPLAGFRREADDMLNVIPDLVVPTGEGKSKWGKTDFNVVLQAFTEQGFMCSGGDGLGLTAEFPFLSFTSLFQAVIDEPHPQLGNGLLLRLTLPSKPDGDPYERVLYLNELELKSLTLSHMLGSWCVGSLGVTFVAFFPNATHDLNFINVALSMVLRARWVVARVFASGCGTRPGVL